MYLQTDPSIYCGVFLLSLNLCGYSSHLILVTKLCLILYCAFGKVGVCGVCGRCVCVVSVHETINTRTDTASVQQPNEYLVSLLLVSEQTLLVYEGSPPAFDAVA